MAAPGSRVAQVLRRRVKGVGPVLAEAIATVLGDDAVNVISQGDVDTLVPGIGRKSALRIVESWKRSSVQNELVLDELTGLGLSHGLAEQVCAHFGAQKALQVARSNPYLLAAHIKGIGFQTAERIARSVGIHSDSILRVDGAILFALQHARRDGHCCLPEPGLLRAAARVLELPADSSVISESLRGLETGQFVASTMVAGVKNWYLAWVYSEEQEVAARLADLSRSAQRSLALSRARSVRCGDSAAALDAEGDGVDAARLPGGGRGEAALTEEQLKAVRLALDCPMLVLTGGPGVGKTTTLRAIVAAWKAAGMSVKLAAPTARAAKRMDEAVGEPGSSVTVHRLLQFSPRDNSFAVNQQSPLSVNAVVVDEASMLDLTLSRALLRALPRDGSCRLLLVGDSNQLPSVAHGAVLRDTLASGCVPHVELTQVFRQAQQSQIVVNAHRVHHGTLPLAMQVLQLRDLDLEALQRQQAGRAAHMRSVAAQAVCSRTPHDMVQAMRSQLHAAHPTQPQALRPGGTAPEDEWEAEEAAWSSWAGTRGATSVADAAGGVAAAGGRHRGRRSAQADEDIDPIEPVIAAPPADGGAASGVATAAASAKSVGAAASSRATAAMAGARSALSPVSDCLWVDAPAVEDGAVSVLEPLLQYVRRLGFDPVSDVQLLTPVHRGPLGTQQLNAALQQLLNPHATSIATAGATQGSGAAAAHSRFLRDDRVINLVNDYDKGVFNGDFGIVASVGGGVVPTVSVAYGQGQLGVEGSTVVSYSESEARRQLSLAYAITVHKAQGAEYPVVFLPLYAAHSFMFTRNLLYTALTRARVLAVLFGEREALRSAVRKTTGNSRWTGLADMLRANLLPA